MTVRNERALLRSNLLYHHHLGVEACYVYDDGSDDGTPATVADLAYVAMRPSVAAAEVGRRAGLDELLRQTATHFSARQLLNTVHAMALAQHDGYSWLLAIDADEFVVLDLGTSPRGALADALASVAPSVVGALFRPLEMAHRQMAYQDVLVQETLFKRTGTTLRHTIFDPFANRQVAIPIVYGHTAGKQAVRLGVRLAPHTVHRFAGANGRPVRSVWLGHLLHYYAHDAETFISKFQLIADHPDRHVRGEEVVIQKRLWRDVVNKSGYDVAQLHDYFRRWVLLDQAELARLSRPGGVLHRGRAPLVEVVAVRDALLGMAAGRFPAGINSRHDDRSERQVGRRNRWLAGNRPGDRPAPGGAGRRHHLFLPGQRGGCRRDGH